jgi:hypothetical protein
VKLGSLLLKIRKAEMGIGDWGLGTGEQGSRGAGEQGSRGAGEQGRITIAYCLLPIAYCLLPIAYKFNIKILFCGNLHLTSVAVNVPKLLQ